MAAITKRQIKKIKQNKEKKLKKKKKKKKRKNINNKTEFYEGCLIWGGGIKKR